MKKQTKQTTRRKPNLVLYLVIASVVLLLLSLLFSTKNATESQKVNQPTIPTISPIQQDNLSEEELKELENHEPYEEPAAE
jgi:hypothetical protein